MNKTYSWLPNSLGLAAILVTILFVNGTSRVHATAASDTDPTQAAFPNSQASTEAAVTWLIDTHQNDDGGYSSFSVGANQAPSDPAGTIDALLALAWAEVDLTAPLTFLQNNADAVAEFATQGGGMAGKSILALVAGGVAPADFGGHNLVTILTDQLTPEGHYNVMTAFDQSLAIMALAIVSEPIPDEAIAWLLSLQAKEGDFIGSWDDGFGTAGNADATAMATMALLRSGLDSTDANVVAAKDFLAITQLASGGWEYGLGFGENANSTSLVIQALVFLREDISSPDSDWLQDVLPKDALMAWQGESGAFQADFGEGRFDDFFATVQSIPGVALPLEVIPPLVTKPTEMPEETPTAEPAEAEASPTTETVVEATTTTAVESGPTSTPLPDSSNEEGDSDSSNNTIQFLIIGAILVVVAGGAIWLFTRRRTE